MTTRLILAFALLGGLTVAGVVLGNLPREEAPIVVAWGGGGRR